MRRGLCILVLISIAMLAPGIAHAATCTVTANSFSFGNYDVMSATPMTTTGSNLITVTCSGGSGTMTVNLSTGGSGSYIQRAMKNGTNTLTYNLYTTANLTTIWGNGTGGTGNIVQTYKNKSTTQFNVYGQIPAQQNVVSGSYSDSITVTVSF